MENTNLIDQEQAFEESKEKIFELLEEKKYFRCKDELLKFNAVDIAELLEEVMRKYNMQTAIILFRTLPKGISVEVFARFDVDDQVEIINIITDPEIKYIIEELDFDDMIDVLDELPANIVDKILDKTPKNERRQINAFLKYKEYSAGSLMTPDYINLRKNMTRREALDHIRDVGMNSETIYSCYVLDGGRKLVGVVSLRSLVLADENTKVSNIMKEDIIYAHVDDDQEETSELFKKYGFIAIPVVDNEDRLVGIITFDDILDVIEEENTEDMERMGGVIDNTDKDYLDTPVLMHVKARLPWLLVLMVSYVFTGGMIASFEKSLSAVIALVAYMPMLMGTGGNSGTQSSTVIITGMATGDLELSDVLRVLWKEFRIGIIVGICVSILNYIRIVAFDHNGSMVALTVCLSMVLIVIIAKCIGALLPMIAKKIGIDPALIAGPMMASLTDMVALGTYFTMARLVLKI
ncbi:magnesium transporter [Mogibacterium neglectum]|uniref:magnesium transporter n=1 Tax=Mogibacterium neglectum TaxID=114528 RepID=UPI00272B3272|nr:magnesium transporter [Mogibacterium neglectum]WLD76592.1 magnesium transporter [Mogibacterium neglectum]